MNIKNTLPSKIACFLLAFAGFLPLLAATPAPSPSLWLRSDENVHTMPSMQTGMDTVVQWSDYLMPWRGAEAPGYWHMGEDSGFTLIHNGLNGSPSLRYEPMWSNEPGLRIFNDCIDYGASSAEYFVLLKSDPWAFGTPVSLGHSWGLEYSGQSFIRDSFGRGYDSVDMDSMSVGLMLDDWRIYHAAATPSEWFARLDGNTLAQTPATPFQVYPWNGGIGLFPGWSGEIAEIIVYSRTLTEPERQQTTDYLRARRGGSIGSVTPPASLSTSAIDFNYATLQWAASPTPGVWYEIERRTGTSGAWTLVYSTSTGQTSHTDYNLSPSTTYQYRIRAVKNGIRSDYGATLTVTTPAGTPPPPPANFTATYVGPDPETGSPLVRLEWTLPNPTPDNYLLYVKNGNFNQFFGAQYISGRDTYHVTTRASWGQPNYYKLTSLKHPLESAFSEQAMLVIKPQKPSGPVANNISDTSIRLMWFDSWWDGNTFELQRKPASAGDGAWETIYTAADPGDINGNGVIYYTDSDLLSGTAYNYRLRNHNSGGSSDYSYYTHTTTGEPPDDGEPPVAISQAIALFQDTPQTITLQGYSAEGNSLTYVIVANPANGTLTGAPPSLTYTPNTSYTGEDSFTFKVNDGNKDSAPATVSLDIYPPDADSATRRLVITTPANDATLLTRTEIKGSALDPDFDCYELQYRPVAAAGATPASWTTFARDIRRVGIGSTPGTLGHLEPGMMRNGVYELRILLHTASGSPATRESACVRVMVDGQRKIGPFTISFKDYSGSASGVPIEVVRTYDSRDRDIDGDFGHGWNLAVNTITLRKNQSIATGWEQVRSGLYVPTYSLQKQSGARHLIALQFPDGSTSTFEVNAACSYNYPLYNNPSRTTPVFQSAGNRSKGTLAIAATPTSFYISATPDQEDNGPVTLSTQSYAYYNAYHFNPTRFTYTDVAGNKYTIDERLGLIDQTTPQGQKITFNRDAQGRVTGYTHSNGTSLTIHRDPITHRITSITTPEGDTIAYTYDANGDLTGHTDRAGATTSFTYYTNSPDPRDAHLAHFLKEIIDPNNTPAIRNEYDEQGRLIRQTDALGNPVEYTHNTEASTEIVTDRLGYSTAHAYDDEGNITRTVQADGSEINYAFGDPFNPNAVTQKTDPLGRVTTYEYDSAGRVKKETNDLGESTETTYNAQGNPTQSKDARGNITKTDYLGNGLPSKLTDAEGNATTFDSYDARGNPTQFTDATGRTSQVTYTAADKILTQTSPDGVLTTFEYDAHGHVSKRTRVKNSLTEITEYINDAEGRVLQTTHPDGTITTTQYNPSGKPVLVTDAAGRATATEYDAAGNVIKTTITPASTANGEQPIVTETIHDAESRATHKKDAAGIWTRAYYDPMGRAIATYHLGSGLTRAQAEATAVGHGEPVSFTRYDAAGQVTDTYDALGNRTHYTYDGAGRRETVTPSGATPAIIALNAKGDALDITTDGTLDVARVSTNTYDANGNLLVFTDANGHVTTHTYDKNNRRTRTDYHDGTFTETEYDELGRRKKVTDAEGKTTTYAYAPGGQLATVTDHDGNITTYTYDDLGRQIGQTDAENRTTTYTYNASGQRETRRLPLGQTEALAYNPNGSLATRTDFNGETTTYAYDGHGNPITVMPSAAARARGALSTHRTYDAAGRLTRVEQRDAADTVVWAENHLYDGHGRLRKKETTAGIIEYAFDARGNIERVSTNHGTSTDYYYDSDSRLAAVEDQDGNTTIYGYNNVGSLATVTLPNGVTTGYTYNQLNRLTNITTTGPGGAVATFDYTLRPSGHRSQLSETIGGVSRTLGWTYDNLYRLTEETVNGTDTVNYTYDKVGNRQSRTGSAGVSPAFQHLPAVSAYDYDANDRLLATHYPLLATRYSTYDNNGNTLTGHANTAGINYLTGQPLTAQTVTDVYDHNNRLIKRVGGGNTITIIYDADGNRVGKTVNGNTTYYLVDTNNLTGYAQVIEEVQGGIVQKRYNYGLDLISQQHRQGDGTYQIRYYGYDGLGSIRYLTDDTGVITDRYIYDAYGTLIDKWSAGTATNNVYLYAGEQYDADLGLYYNRARYLNTDVGRFWTMDEFEGNSREPVSLHKYLYTHANPINGIDPSGNFAVFGMYMNYFSMMGSLVLNVYDFAQSVAGGMLMTQALTNAGSSFVKDTAIMVGVPIATAVVLKFAVKWIRYLKTANDSIKIFTSPDKYVGETATILDNVFPGKVQSINQMIPMRNGGFREVDIVMDNIIIQVKSGKADKLASQIRSTQADTTKMVIGFAPDDFSGLAWTGAAKEGIAIARNLDELLAIINLHL